MPETPPFAFPVTDLPGDRQLLLVTEAGLPGFAHRYIGHSQATQKLTLRLPAPQPPTLWPMLPPAAPSVPSTSTRE